MPMKSVRLLCQMFFLAFFGTERAQLSIIPVTGTNRPIEIYWVTICEQKPRIVQGQAASNINCSTSCLFIFDVCWLS